MPIRAVYEIGNYAAVLPMVQNVYGVESNAAGGYCWGLEYTSGVFEFFHHADEAEAVKQMRDFV